MSKILFLDDMEERHKEFQRVNRFAGHDIVYVWTAAEAIEKLSTEYFVQAFLDHDLSHDDIMVKARQMRTSRDSLIQMLSKSMTSTIFLA